MRTEKNQRGKVEKRFTKCEDNAKSKIKKDCRGKISRKKLDRPKKKLKIKFKKKLKSESLSFRYFAVLFVQFTEKL
jgi:hypothetical protein